MGHLLRWSQSHTLSQAVAEQENVMSKSNGRAPKRELVIVAAKLPRGVVCRLDRAAGNSWDTRNTVIRSILEQYLSG